MIYDTEIITLLAISPLGKLNIYTLKSHLGYFDQLQAIKFRQYSLKQFLEYFHHLDICIQTYHVDKL